MQCIDDDASFIQSESCVRCLRNLIGTSHRTRALRLTKDGARGRNTHAWLDADTIVFWATTVALKSGASIFSRPRYPIQGHIAIYGAAFLQGATNKGTRTTAYATKNTRKSFEL